MENIENKAEQFAITSVTDQDIFLEILLKLGDSTDAEFPITLFVKGLLVSGDLISELKYQKDFAEGSVDKTLQDAYRKGELKLPEKDVEDLRKPTYIHLRNAKVLLGANQSPIPHADGGLWRGKISSIDGFWLGKMSVA